MSTSVRPDPDPLAAALTAAVTAAEALDVPAARAALHHLGGLGPTALLSPHGLNTAPLLARLRAALDDLDRHGHGFTEVRAAAQAIRLAVGIPLTR